MILFSFCELPNLKPMEWGMLRVLQEETVPHVYSYIFKDPSSA